MDTLSIAQQKALDWIFRAEGGLVDDPDDPGGITNYGVSLRWLKTKGKIGDIDGDGDVDGDDIRKLSRDIAARMYISDFWHPCRCDDLPPSVTLAVFDCAVNCGQRTAILLFQESLHVKIDGIIGPVTIRHAFKPDVLPQYMGKRAEYYHDITLANSRLAKFLRGWFNRLFHLQSYITRGVTY